MQRTWKTYVGLLETGLVAVRASVQNLVTGANRGVLVVDGSWLDEL